MAKAIFLLLSVFSSSAFSQFIEPDFKGDLTEIKSDIQLYCDISSEKIKNIEFYFAKLVNSSKYSIPKIGICRKFNGQLSVLIDQKSWANMSSNKRYQVLAHETSHCILGLEHTADQENYMYPVIRKFLSRNQVRQQLLANIRTACREKTEQEVLTERAERKELLDELESELDSQP